MAEVHHERRGNVALLTLNRPVANALAASLRTELRQELARALADDAVCAIVLTGAGADFSCGVDVTEYDGDLTGPWINDLCLQIENASKPVVAALHGAVLGGGFELALAAHGRIAAQGARIGLPEVQLGLIPNGGSTQRLPRLAGAQVSLELMLSGQSVSVSDPRLKHVIDAVVPDDVVEAAVIAARTLADAGDWVRAGDRRTGLSDPLTYQNTVAELRGTLRISKSAEADIVTCVEAAQLLPYARGLELEFVRFEDRRHTADARARRHFHVAERRAMILPERASGRAMDINEVLVPGSGGLVTELAVACLDAGMRVSIMAEDVDATEELRATIESIYDEAVAHKIRTPADRDAVMALLTPDWPEQALLRADLVLDTGQIDLSAHHTSLHPRAIWACVTSDDEMPVTAPQNIGGRHVDLRVYRPVLSLKLVELCVPPHASADAVVTVAEMLNRSGRTVIRCACVEGLVGGNMSAALYSAALALAKSGVGPYRIDAAARSLGFAKGPFRMMDDEGLPTVAERLRRRAERGGPGDSDVLAPRIASGATGRAAGRGFYLYDEHGIHQDPDLKDRVSGNLPPLQADPRTALTAAMANEAARLLSAGVVQRASDIDVVMVRVFGFEPQRGGPVFQANAMGAFQILQDLRRMSELSAALWTPHGAIEEMVKNGEGFFGRTVRGAA